MRILSLALLLTMIPALSGCGTVTDFLINCLTNAQSDHQVPKGAAERKGYASDSPQGSQLGMEYSAAARAERAFED